MGIKWNRENLVKEAATEVRDVDFSYKGLDKKANEINLDVPLEEIESEILHLAWYIQPGKVSSVTETVISLLAEEAFKVQAPST